MSRSTRPDLIRQAYAEAVPATSPFPTWEDAFLPRSTLTLKENVGGVWRDWPFEFPRRGGVPGTKARNCTRGARRRRSHFSIYTFIRAALERLKADTAEAISHSLSLGDLAELVEEGGAFDQALGALRQAFQHPDAEQPGAVEEPLTEIVTRMRAARAPPSMYVVYSLSVDIQRLLILTELAAAVAIGLAVMWMNGETLGDLDRYDFIEWLDMNAVPPGLSPEASTSAPVRMAYELVFAYVNGDPLQPSLAAGVALRGLGRLGVDYADAVAYDMAAGMGETVIAPFYRLIKKRSPKTKFRFFHRVTGLALSADKKRVEKIRLRVQATPKSTYKPLIKIGGLHCWPSKPKYAQLDQGVELENGGHDLEDEWTDWPGVSTKVLALGKDFDVVLLAIPSSALGCITQELAAASPAWQLMLDNVTGVPTISMQLWFQAGAMVAMAGAAPAAEPSLIGAYADHLGTIMDMSRILAFEQWIGIQPTSPVYYFCGPFMATGTRPGCSVPDPGYKALNLQKAYDEAIWWVENYATGLLANATSGGGFDWNALMGGGVGSDRIYSQYVRANVGLSGSYITSFPGTTQHRLHPGTSGFENLYLAGDWTRCGLNAGALEAAVTSGRMAARAIMGESYCIYGEDDD